MFFLEYLFDHFQKELEDRKYKIDVPQMPVGVGIQNYDNWEKELNNETKIVHILK